MLLLRSLGRFLSPYSKTCMRASLELLTYPYGRNRADTPVQSAEYGTFRRDLRCARRNFFCSLLSILNSLLRISGVQVPYSAHETPVRRPLRGTAKEGQSNKKCSVSLMPSFDGHNGFIVSLKLCLNL